MEVIAERITILGVPIDAVTADQAAERLHYYLSGRTQHHVVTTNSEMLVEASRNSTFQSVLEKSSLNLPDSVGLLLAVRLTGQVLPERVAGVDAVERLCLELTEQHPVFALGGREGVGKRALQALQCRNPRLRIAGAFEGSPREEDAGEIAHHINSTKPHVLLVAFGAPVQDLWIAKHVAKFPTVRLAIGVGGTFDFLTGTVKRAPQFLQAICLEWLWRLIRQPWRLPRIWKAVVVFPFLVMQQGRGRRSKVKRNL